MTKDEIMNAVGADFWGQVIMAFDGDDPYKILDELNDMFPQDDNQELADAIYDKLSAE